MNDTSYRTRREDRIRYALSKQVPAMRFSVEIHTDYGTLSFYDKDAKRIAEAAPPFRRSRTRLCWRR